MHYLLESTSDILFHRIILVLIQVYFGWNSVNKFNRFRLYLTDRQADGRKGDSIQRAKHILSRANQYV